MRRTLLALLLAGLTAPAVAQPKLAAPAARSGQVDEARLVAARELLRVQGVGAMMERMYRDLAPSMALGVLGSLATNADAKPLLDQLEARGEEAKQELVRLAAEEFLASMTRRIPQLLERFAVEYASSFTEQELKDALAFFSSPSGLRFLELQPHLQERGRQIGMDLGQEAGREGLEAALERLERADKPIAVHPGT